LIAGRSLTTDRKAQFDAAMKVHALFGDGALLERIVALRKALAQSAATLPEGDPLRKTSAISTEKLMECQKSSPLPRRRDYRRRTFA
jgi:hypothetical protein